MAGHWTEERDEEMLRLRRQKYSAANVAAMLGDGLTRNAVLGRLHRLGIKEGKVVTKRQTVRNPDANKPVRKLQANFALPARQYVAAIEGTSDKATFWLHAPPRPKSRIVCTEADISLASVPLDVRMMDLTADSCRWPVNDPDPKGEHLFCGHPKKYGSYCAAHAAMSVGQGTFAEAMADKLGWAA